MGEATLRIEGADCLAAVGDNSKGWSLAWCARSAGLWNATC
jgi:hypothetical protein